MIYPNYVKQSPVLGLTSGAAGGASLSYFTHVVAAPPGGDDSGSVSFDGSNDYLEVPKSTDFDFGGAFTMEAWVYADSLTTNSYSFNALDSIFESIDWNSQLGQYSFGISHENKLYFYIFDGSNTFYYGTTVLSTQQWYHLAVSRDSSGNIRLFVNGGLESTNNKNYSLSNSNQPNPARIGGCKINNSGSGIQKSFDGFISNLRVIKGTTLYTSNFNPSSTPLTAVTNTKLLCCKSKTSVTDADVTPGTIVNNGGATVSTSNPFAAGSVIFDGNGDYLTIPSSSDLTFGTGNFTVEMWVYADNFNNRNTFYDSRPSGGTTGLTIGSEVSTGQLKVYMNASSGSDQIVDTTDFSAGLWHHIAVTCASGSVRLFVNGVLKDTGTGRNLSNTNAVNIGYKTYTSSSYDYMDGRISNFRAIKGTALYTSNFTVPTSPLTAVTNTTLLCCQSAGPATDAAVTPGIISTNGNPAGSTSSPFTNVDGGGSLYLDGSSVVKITSDSAAASIFNISSSTAFTIEAWVYPTSFSTYNNIMSGWDGSCNHRGVLFHVTSSGQIFFGGPGGSTYTSNASSPVTLNNWHHVAVTRNSSGDGEFYIDGVSAGSFSNNNAMDNHGCGVFIGANMDGGADGSGGMYRFTGYISNLRYVVGHETYTSGFTPSTQPFTPTSQGVPSGACKFLACQDETSIDTNSISVPMTADYGTPVASGKNPFGAVSPGGGETSGSVSFDGSDDHLNITGSDLAFGTGNFTLEFWVYFSSSDSTLDTIMETRSNTSLSDGFLIGRFHTSGYENKIALYTGGYRIASNSGVSNNTWTHVAVVRTGSTTKMYIDGVAQSTTYSDSNNYSNDDLIIGENANNTYQLHGLISNFRMVKGTAVYTSNFTVPTATLTAVTNTKLLCCQSAVTVTDAAVTPGTITSNGDPQASGSTPFVTLPSSAVFYASGADFTDGGPNSYTITKVGNGLTSGNNTSKSGGGSFRFDGSDTQQYFYAGSNTFLDDSLSSWQFQCWARYDNTSGQAGNSSGDMGMLVDQYPGSSYQGRLLFGFQENQLVMRVNGGTVELTSGSILSNNTWYHVLLNWDGTTHRLFTDGILRDSSTTVPAVYTGKRTEFGGGGDLSPFNLHGYMEHILVENGGTVKTSNFTPNNSGFVT